MANYHQITLYSIPDAVLPLDAAQRDITLPEAAATPEDIILMAMALYPVAPLAEIVMRETLDPAEILAGVYPAVIDVDAMAAKYGPTGTEFQGSLEQPAPGDVREGIQYGGDGTEFTGTLVSTGGGLDQGSLLIDAMTGKTYIYLNGRLIAGVG